MTSVFGGGGVSPAGVGRQLALAYRAGGFTMMHEGAANGGTAIPAVDVLYVYPFRVYGPAVVSSIFERLQTVGAGSAVKCAVWRADTTTGRPTGLPLFGQNTGFDTTAGTGIKSAAVSNYAITPSVYFAGSVATGTLPVMTSVSASASFPAGILSGASANAAMGVPAAQLTGYSTPLAYAGDIMALDVTGATWSDVGTSGIPIIGLGWA